MPRPILPRPTKAIRATSLLLPRRLDEIDERPQRRGHEAPAGIIQKRPGEALPPRLQDRLEGTAVEMRAQPVLKEVDDAGTGYRGLDHEIGCSTDLYEQWSHWIDSHHFAVALELPRRHRATGKPAAQAGVLEQLARAPAAV